jgi:hypothetical protein
VEGPVEGWVLISITIGWAGKAMDAKTSTGFSLGVEVAARP